jgi:hypothetical protein
MSSLGPLPAHANQRYLSKPDGTEEVYAASPEIMNLGRMSKTFHAALQMSRFDTDCVFELRLMHSHDGRRWALAETLVAYASGTAVNFQDVYSIRVSTVNYGMLVQLVLAVKKGTAGSQVGLNAETFASGKPFGWRAGATPPEQRSRSLEPLRREPSAPIASAAWNLRRPMRLPAHWTTCNGWSPWVRTSRPCPGCSR